MNFISEGDLYRLITHSRLPAAEQFERWVFDEVLPVIQKSGGYSASEEMPKLCEVNNAARFLDKSMREVGVPPEYRIMTVKQLYETVGVKVITQGVTVAPSRLYEATEIAEKLGMRSGKGNSHALAVGAIIEKVGCAEGERTLVPYNKNGHSGASPQYAESVLARVSDWLRENNFPERIVHSGKTFSVLY